MHYSGRFGRAVLLGFGVWDVVDNVPVAGQQW